MASRCCYWSMQWYIYSNLGETASQKLTRVRLWCPVLTEHTNAGWETFTGSGQVTKAVFLSGVHNAKTNNLNAFDVCYMHKREDRRKFLVLNRQPQKWHTCHLECAELLDHYSWVRITYATLQPTQLSLWQGLWTVLRHFPQKICFTWPLKTGLC